MRPATMRILDPATDVDCRCSIEKVCERHAGLSALERAAAEALYDSPIEVGSEGIGGFYAGQAEETIAVLRRAGFAIVRVTDPSKSPSKSPNRRPASGEGGDRGLV